jgi:DNA phosphorothioation-dependent restriction protein DptG
MNKEQTDVNKEQIDMNKEQMIKLKEEYEKQLSEDCKPFLCHLAYGLGIIEEFQDYLLNNLDNTMINAFRSEKYDARWFIADTQGRLNWLDKHIELLGNV